MPSDNPKRQKLDKSRRPLKAFQLPTSASTPSISTANEKSRKGTNTCWMDSEDNRIPLNHAECSSPSIGSPGSLGINSLLVISPPIVEKTGLRQHYQTIVGNDMRRNDAHLVERKGTEMNSNLPCACCSPLQSPKRSHVVMGAEGLKRLRGLPTPPKPVFSVSSPSKLPNLSPICPVPMLPSYLAFQCQSDAAISNRRSMASQTSPFEEQKKLKRKHSGRKSGALLSSIKKKISSLRRSSSTEKFPSRALFQDMPGQIKLNQRKSDSRKPTTCTLLQRFPDGSRIIQLIRPSLSAQFGLYIRDDERGMLVTRLGSLKFSEKNNFLHRGDCILEVQHIPSKQLNCNEMRRLLKRSLTVIIKVASVST
ncbi:hypothetical protein Aperf_G00000097024 [Anoplocephala perfoliata]